MVRSRRRPDFFVATPAWHNGRAAPQDPKAQAQFEFMMGRRWNRPAIRPAALASLERARKLDPEAARFR